MSKRMKRSFICAVMVLAVISITALAQQVPQISLRSTDGRTLNLADLKGKAVVLSFGGTWVPLTAKELPALQKQADRYTPRGVQFFWVSVNSDKPGTRTSATDADLNAFIQKNNVRLTVLRDPDQQAYKALGLDGLPAVVIISNGKVVLKHIGFGTEQNEGYSEIAKTLDQLLK
ncbi:MAG: TlpA family protein disulfide reductase [Acidobacteria bacterium]|nr:TlpA family protein disulfide reductase [Acidobacteriota bacterium]